MINYNNNIMSLDENIQYIYLSIFIMLFIVIILFYLKDTNRKHYKLFEEYGETVGGVRSYSTQQLDLDPTTQFYPSEESIVSLRPCEIRFNKNGSSKHIFNDGWKEIATINNNYPGEVNQDLTYPKKILTKEGNNKADFNNFSEESRCFKLKNENNDLNTHKYAENNMISYNKNKYTKLQTIADGNKEYIQMNFNPSLDEQTDYHKYAIDSVCSYTYDNILTPPLNNLVLYRIFMDNENIVQAINKIEINATNNNIFADKPFSLTELLDTSSTSYYYENSSFNFKINKNDKIPGIMIFKFERNLLCDKEEIVSYEKLISDDTKINTVSLINIDNLIAPIPINDTELTRDILDKYRKLVRYYNDKRELIEYYEPIYFNDKKSILDIIRTHIDALIDTLNIPILRNIETKNAELAVLNANRNVFAEKISTIEKYIENIITMDSENYDEETKGFLSKYLKPGKITYQKYIENKILEPIITDTSLSPTLLNARKTINYAFGDNKGQILAMPHFPDAHLISNANRSLTRNGWTIASSLNTITNQGLSAILKDSAKRVKTQTITIIKQQEVVEKVIFYQGTNYNGKIIYEAKQTIWEYVGWMGFGSIIVPEGWTINFYGLKKGRNYYESDYYTSVYNIDKNITHNTYRNTREQGDYVWITCNRRTDCSKPIVKEVQEDTPQNSAYGANGINPEITITMPTVYYISGFEFYGINGLHHISHNARRIEVYGIEQNNRRHLVLKFELSNTAMWNSSQFYKLDRPDNYKQIVFKVISNWGNNTSTKIGSITLYHHPTTTNAKSMSLPTDISVKINGSNRRLPAGDYNMTADIHNKIYTLTHKQTHTRIATLQNANNLAISYDVPKDMSSLLEHNREKVSFNSISNEIREKDKDNLIILTANKNLDTYETYRIRAYVYNNSSYRPNIKLYDASKREINSTKYKIRIDDYPTNRRNVIIILNIYIIVDISITGAIYLKTMRNNNDLFEYNRVSVSNITNAIRKSVNDSKNAKKLDDLRDIFDITEKEDEIDVVKLTLINKSTIRKNKKGNDILNIKRDIVNYEDDVTINRLKKTYNNLSNLGQDDGDISKKVFINEINIDNALIIPGISGISDKSDKVDKYSKYISYQDVDRESRTPSIEKVQSDEIYNIKDYANKYIYFTLKI